MTDQKPPNILFIMCDQLRWDYLSCAGHPTINTPNIDRLAASGVRFDRCYVQSPVCGPSRASTYTGRTVSSHGVTWNGVPLSVAELTMGDYLRRAGYRVAVAGKTHLIPDVAGIERVGQSLDTERGRELAAGGFEPYDHDDGLHTAPYFQTKSEPKYSKWLKSLGYDGDIPWHDYANGSISETGETLSAWNLRAARYPARVPAEHSETPYFVNRAIEFIDGSVDAPWLLHLSFIKPHWPYVAPPPYHALYGQDDVPAPVRAQTEQNNVHPVFKAFQNMRVSTAFSTDEVRDAVIPVYMGLIHQIDDELGRLFAHLEATGTAENTVIVFTSDHGDYLGDHWLGEKELFHDCSARVPLIVADPRPGSDATRGTVVTELVEAIDLLPTFIELAGLPPDEQRLEGRSLVPFLSGDGPENWRDAAFSELDYAFYAARLELGIGANDAKIFMLCGERHKYIHYLGYAPQLYDLEADPNELVDLGQAPEHAAVRTLMQEQLFDRLARRRSRVTESDASVAERTANEAAVGIHIGMWE